MATFITPDYIFNKIKQRPDETAVMYRERLSQIMLDETEDQTVRTAANDMLHRIMSYE